MKIENVPISEIIPYERNPRKNDKAVDIVAKSIKEFGFRIPIILDKDNVIIAGHTRLKAAQKLNLKEVPVIWADDLTEEQVKAFRIMDNKSHEYSEWDRDLLIEELKELENMNVDLEITGFSAPELNEFLKLEDPNFDVDREVEEAIEKGPQRVKEGEIWQLGDHKLIIGSATDENAWKRLLGKEKFDFMFTDPPYKLAYTERIRNHKEGKPIKSKGRFKRYSKTKDGFGYRSQRRYLGVEKEGGVPEYDEWLSIAKKYQNEGGANIMVFENWKNTPELWQSMEKYWKIRNMIIWHLPNRCQGFSREYFFFNKYDIALLGEEGEKEINQDYEPNFEEYMKEKGQKLLDTYEVILYGQSGDSTWNKKKKTPTAHVNDHITWSADTAAQSGQNLVFGTKPIQILIPYMKVLSNPGEIIMEPFGGSGSTLIASEILGRKCRVIEIEPIYAEVIIKRWEKFTGQEAKKIK